MIKSLSLLAYHSSQRRCSCLFVKFKDITCHLDKNGEVSAVTIVFQRKKGVKDNLNQNLLITKMKDPEMCFINSLDNYVQENYSIKLSELKNSKYKTSSQLVWPCTKNVFSQTFNYVSYMSGYARNTFSPHSLRSGHICTLLTNACCRDDFSFNELFDHARRNGGWIQNSEAHQAYYKKIALVALVPSRFVDPENVKPLGEQSLLNPELFHNLKSIVSIWPDDLFYQMFREKLKQFFLEKIGIDDLNTNSRQLLRRDFGYIYNQILNSFCKLKFLNLYDQWVIENNKHDLVMFIASKMRKEIIERILKTQNDFQELYEKFKNLLNEYDQAFDATSKFGSGKFHVRSDMKLKASKFHVR